MKKAFYIFCAALFFVPKMNAQDFYTISVKDINNQVVKFDDFRGKKVLLVTISTDTSFFKTFSEFKTIAGDSLVIVGIPACESGFTSADLPRISAIYGSLNIVILQNQYVKKSSLQGQSNLFQWLTKRENNHHFDVDVKGFGDKFFVSEDGDLYASFNSDIDFSNAVIKRVIARKKHS
jgi:glutathione peroxidase